jgi:hypothetical protein
VCGCEIGYDKTWQLWISLKVGTDVLPMLVNSCSRQCTESLPTPHENDVREAHRGGTSLVQPPAGNAMMMFERCQAQAQTPVAATDDVAQAGTSQKPPSLKPVWKIWGR